MASYTELALKVAAAKQAGDDLLIGEAGEAWKQICQLVTRLAWATNSVRSQLLRQGARDFAEGGAQAHVFSKILQFRTWYQRLGPQDPQGASDPFVPWCRTVLDHKYTDLVRKQSRELAHRRNADLSRRADPGLAEPWQKFEELSGSELARLKSLDPLDGVIIFTLTRHWSMVPGQMWRAWLAECGLDESFPPESVRAAGKHQERQALADALGISRNTLDQRMSRLRRGV